MKPNEKHSPLPWVYLPAKNCVPRISSGSLYDLPAEVICFKGEQKIRVGGISEEGDANAEFITRAVNNHASLLLELEKALQREKELRFALQEVADCNGHIDMYDEEEIPGWWVLVKQTLKSTYSREGEIATEAAIAAAKDKQFRDRPDFQEQITGVRL